MFTYTYFISIVLLPCSFSDTQRRFSLKCFKTLLMLCKLVLGCAVKCLFDRSSWGNVYLLEFIMDVFVNFPKK